ncbi:MAG: CapA family protein [Prevotella sp.]|nr:CapA family protein [Prevotella sp.]
MSCACPKVQSSKFKVQSPNLISHSSLLSTPNTQHPTPNTPSGGFLTITFTGDMLFDRGVRRVIQQHGYDWLFSPSVDSVFRSSQYVVGNLECPATRRGYPMYKRFMFRADPECLDALQRHGVTHLNLANNHSIDQNREGLTDTRNNIIRAGMTPFGADTTMAAAQQPLLLTHLFPHRGARGASGASPRPVYMFASLQMALENYTYLPDTPSPSMFTTDSLARHISLLRSEQPNAYIIVCLHWGAEHTLTPLPQQRMQAHQLVRAGADIIIGHHTHTLQTIENFEGHPIYYSIGNFIFDQTRPINTRACMVKLTITPTDAHAETIPVTIRNCVPHVDAVKQPVDADNTPN